VARACVVRRARVTVTKHTLGQIVIDVRSAILAFRTADFVTLMSHATDKAFVLRRAVVVPIKT